MHTTLLTSLDLVVCERPVCIPPVSCLVLSVSLCLLCSSQPEQPFYFSIKLIARPTVCVRLFVCICGSSGVKVTLRDK